MKTFNVNIKDEVKNLGVYRMDWATGKMVKIEGVTLEIGQKVRIYEYAMNWRDYVCVSEPDGRNCQQLVEIGGSHRRSSWEVGMNDRSTNEVFGIGKYYDPSGFRMDAAEIAKHVRAAEIQERWNERKAENQRKADEMERAELRKKWAGVLVPLEDLNDWKEKEQQEKANIINYLHYHFPRTKFTARKGNGGHYYVISWQDGPSIEQVKQLSYIWHDHTFDMYQDYNEYTPTQFNRLFGGVEYSCDFNRRYSAGALETARGLFRSILPELSDLIGTGKAKELRRDDCDALNDWANMTVNRHRDNETARAIHEAGRDRVRNWHDVNPDYIINDYLDAQDLTPSEPSTDPEKPRKARKQSEPTNTKTEATETETAPANGLHLVDIAGGVAVVGDDWKDTYFNKRQIKAHGAKWNKEAKQWQATEAEDVEKLRLWFALRDGEQAAEAPTTCEEGAEALHGANITDFERQCDRKQAPGWLKPGATFKRTMKDGREVVAICTRLLLDGFGYLTESTLNAVDHIVAFNGFNFENVAPVSIEETDKRFSRMFRAFHSFRKGFENYHTDNI